MPNSRNSQYLSIRATPRLVGRKSIVAKMRLALENPSPIPIVFFIVGKGGMGKTRLAESFLELVGGGSGNGSHLDASAQVAKHPIDLYHLSLHREEALIEEIVEMLGPGSAAFPNYEREKKKLDHIRQGFGEAKETSYQRKIMQAAFIADFNQLSAANSKVLFALDTIEAVEFEPDDVREALGLQSPGIGGWITQAFLPELKRAVVLLTGRDETPQLKKNLQKLADDGKIILENTQLPPFDLQESRAYFSTVAQAAEAEDMEVANRIKAISAEQIEALHTLSGGEPLLLALAIDYLVLNDFLIPEMQIPVSRAEENDRELAQSQDNLREAILNGFMNIDRTEDEIIQALAWARRGMGYRLLAWVRAGGKPSEEELEQSKKDIELFTDVKRRLSFIKLRRNGKLIFLQDEVYAMFDKVYQSELFSKKRKRALEAIVGYYNEIIAQTRNEVEKASQHELSHPWKEVAKIAAPEAARMLDEETGLRRMREDLFNYQVEQVFYQLQLNPEEGFNLYQEYTDEVLNDSRNPDQWMPLHDILLKYLKSQKDERQEKLKEVDVYGDIGTRWIQISIQEGNFDDALDQMNRFREKCADYVPVGSWVAYDLNLMEARIHSRRGEFQQAEQYLQGILEFANQADQDASTTKRQIDRLKAFTLSEMGFLYRSKGDFRNAIQDYKASLPLWRDLKLEASQANVLNNLAWALAEEGDFKIAEIHCEDGLKLRKKMVGRKSIGLSLNTLGLIKTRGGNPAVARLHCEQALGIFRDLEDPAGIGLACTALAEALRRMVNIPYLLADTAILETLGEAEKYAREAVEIFYDKRPDPLREVEARLEFGCVYREWSRRIEDGTERANLYTKGVTEFEKAADLAKSSYGYRAVDVLVNLAFLHYYNKEFKEAIRILEEEVFEIILQDHQIDQRRDFPSLYKIISVSWFWVQLGKAYLLKGRIAFEYYKNALDAEKGKRQLTHPSTTKTWQEHLAEAASAWALSLAYDACFGSDFRDLNSGKMTIYDLLRGLNVKELELVKKAARKTYRDYHIPSSHRLFVQFINSSFGLDVERNS